jgi:hypothetical protein
MASRSTPARVGAILGVSAVLSLTAGPATAATPKDAPPTVRVDSQEHVPAPAVLSAVLTVAGGGFLLVQRRRRRA